MVDPEVSPEQTCMLGRFPVVLWAKPPLKGHDISIEATPCPHSSTRLLETSSSEQVPPEQPRVAILYPHHTGVDDTTTMLVYLASYQDVVRKIERRLGYATVVVEKKKLSFENSPLPPSRATAPAGHPPLENRRLRPQKQIHFLYSERKPRHSPAIHWRRKEEAYMA